MDENKKIEKISEQSAEKVAGGAKDHEVDLEHFKIYKPPASIDLPHEPQTLRHRKCAGCGRLGPFFSYDGTVYCDSCWKKHEASVAEPAPSADAGLGN